MTYNQLRIYAITALGLLGVVSMTLYTGTINRQAKTVDPITVDGQTINFIYTDSTVGEDLIIIANKAEYTDGFSHAVVYLAIANISSTAQNVELVGYFRDNKKKVKDISILTNVDQDYFEPLYTENCTPEASGTTCVQVQTGTTTTQKTKAVWAPLPSISRNSLEIVKEAGLLNGVTRQQVGTFTAEQKSIDFPIKRNEVLYYKVVLEFPPNERDEVFFEAIGSNGGYGFLK